MSYASAKKSYESKAESGEIEGASSWRCAAYGCPAGGSMDTTGSGKFVCFIHGFADPAKWQGVTTKIREMDWFLGIIGDCQRLYTKPDKDRPFVDYAMAFWETDPFMQPTPIEQNHWPLYLERLKSEMSFRCGVNTRRPHPRAPAAPVARRESAPAPTLPTELMSALQRRMGGAWGPAFGPKELS